MRIAKASSENPAEPATRSEASGRFSEDIVPISHTGPPGTHGNQQAWRRYAKQSGNPGMYNSLKSAPVAQLDRAIASGAIGREFESLRARHSSFFAR